MEIYIIGASLAAIVSFLAWRALSPSKDRKGRVYVPVESLCTRRELMLWRSLDQHLSKKGRLVVCPKVRIGDIVSVSAVGKEGWNRLMKVNRKHVDFVIAERDTLKPVIAIELDDSSHNRPDRQARDKLVEQVFANAGIPLLRISTLRMFSREELDRLLSKLGTGIYAQPCVRRLPYGTLIVGSA